MKADTGFIEELRHALLELHKSLLDAQRVRYEREHGRIESSGTFLQLVVQHPSFAWLRALSALIARIDEWVETGEEARGDELPGMVEVLRSLIETGGANAAFNKLYWEIANEVPDVLVAHVKVWRLIEAARLRMTGGTKR